MRNIEKQLLREIDRVMEAKGLNQAKIARELGVSPQSLNFYFKGKRGLLTDTGKNLLELLGVRIRLEPAEGGESDA